MNEFELEDQAIAKITETLLPLNPDAIQRVLQIVTQRFQSKISVQTKVEASVSHSSQGAEPTFSDFHDFFDAAGPLTNSDRALVAAYWFQQILGKEALDGFLLNKELKDLGWPSSNITRDLDTLMKKIPRLITQRKEGDSKQARKTYRLTGEGIRKVQKMLADHRSSTSVESDSNS